MVVCCRTVIKASLTKKEALLNFEGFPYLCNKTYRYQKKSEINPEMIKKKPEIDPDDDDNKYLRLNSLI